jgi:predicted RNA-binding protein with PIN domain
VAVPVVIDGYNLLYARGEAPAAATRERLVRDLVRWAQVRDRRAVVVFDAWAGGARGEQETVRGPVTVCFTRYGERADAWIVRRVTARPEAVVVTSDREVQQAARRRGAAVLDAAAFAARLDAAGARAAERGARGLTADHAALDEPDPANGRNEDDRGRGRSRGRQEAWLRGL